MLVNLTAPTWMQGFIQEYLSASNNRQIILDTRDDIAIRFDPDQLYQVVNNMVSNGLYYSHKNNNDRDRKSTRLNLSLLFLWL